MSFTCSVIRKGKKLQFDSLLEMENALREIDFEHFSQGKLRDRYETYRYAANDGKGNDSTTGKPLLTFDEWLKM